MHSKDNMHLKNHQKIATDHQSDQKLIDFMALVFQIIIQVCISMLSSFSFDTKNKTNNLNNPPLH